MAEQIAHKSLGVTTTNELFINTDDISVIPAVIAGNQTLVLPAGTVLQDGSIGLKVGYTNSDSQPTGVCILLDPISIASGDGAMTVNALIRGTVKKSKILDDGGSAADAAAFTAMPGILAL